MQVTIIETFKYGVYMKAATTVIDGREQFLTGRMISGPGFAKFLSQFEDGMDRVTIVEMSSSAFKMKGVMKLEKSAVAPSNQREEVVA
ncbi:hypothetical protein R7D97_16360 [Vibrio sp. Vb5031]|uniref:Uncharacterized protein n=2 Tax=Vibrio TaxID=662 RepID=A0A0M0HY15_9VIBR|nr:MULTISPECIES: hypothetical protein [Vibrio]KOO06959.1 hypothetical protein AKJ31_14785 [Vibrio hepatarius]MDF5646648.1 hypothetical protein [Vibrio parahaemolyticus]MDF5666093.1 hypothetical protein [Vibrio parahaemolyticus]MDW1505757.1 hypothetical protein [Vibrio sp. Vb5031]MDW1517462.1 hypothetical protein [Vibrio sp. Vb5035]